MAVGGMPQAVEAFVSGKDYTQIDFIKEIFWHCMRMICENMIRIIKKKLQ